LLSVPCVALAGRIDDIAIAPAREQGLTAWRAIHDGSLTPAESIKRAAELLGKSAASLMTDQEVTSLLRKNN